MRWVRLWPNSPNRYSIPFGLFDSTCGAQIGEHAPYFALMLIRVVWVNAFSPPYPFGMISSFFIYPTPFFDTQLNYPGRRVNFSL